jgi:hypothetical protein
MHHVPTSRGTIFAVYWRTGDATGGYGALRSNYNVGRGGTLCFRNASRCEINGMRNLI